jgi:hypothetical protein
LNRDELKTVGSWKKKNSHYLFLSGVFIVKAGYYYLFRSIIIPAKPNAEEEGRDWQMKTIKKWF